MEGKAVSEGGRQQPPPCPPIHLLSRGACFPDPSRKVWSPICSPNPTLYGPPCSPPMGVWFGTKVQPRQLPVPNPRQGSFFTYAEWGGEKPFIWYLFGSDAKIESSQVPLISIPQPQNLSNQGKSPALLRKEHSVL